MADQQEPALPTALPSTGSRRSPEQRAEPPAAVKGLLGSGAPKHGRQRRKREERRCRRCCLAGSTRMLGVPAQGCGA